MNDARTPERERETGRAVEWMRAAGTPEPSPEFRVRLRQEFLTGTIPEPSRAFEWRDSRVRGYRWRAALAVAASLALLWGFQRLNRGPEWRLESVTGPGIVAVDQQPLRAVDLGQLAKLIRPGVRIRTQAASLVLVSPGQIAIEVTPGTDIVLPRVPGHWIDRVARGFMAVGEVRMTTGPAFRGARLEMTTPEAMIRVTGTTLAVIREPAGTCVCVLEGRVMVGANPEDMERVDPGNLRFIFGDGRPSARDAIRPVERVKLTMFRESRLPELTEPPAR